MVCFEKSLLIGRNALRTCEKAIDRSEVAQGTGASFKFEVVAKLTPSHER